MIIRQWRGLAKPDGVAAYGAHFRGEVLPRLRRLAGFRGATVLQRARPDGVEITVLTRWESLDAVRAFAGPDPDAAVVAESARPCFRSCDETVSHHEIAVEEIGPTA